MLVIQDLDGATFERAGVLMAREHAAARQVRPELPAAFGSAEVCAAGLERLCDSGHHGLVATGNGRAVAVMAAIARENPAIGRYARLPAEGFAVDPDLADPTGVLAAAFGDLASPLIASGLRRFALLHAAAPHLPEALSNLGFGRYSAYGIQSAAPRRRSSDVAVHVAGVEHLDTIARLALVELQYRSAPAMFAPRQDRPLADLAAEHRVLHEGGAVHLLATLDGRDVGLLTIELTSPAPRLCPDGQPYIGPTATLPGARGQGVGHALVDAALTCAYDRGYQWVSVDFDTANPLSRPFWLHAGFHPAGYDVGRLIDADAGAALDVLGLAVAERPVLLLYLHQAHDNVFAAQPDPLMQAVGDGPVEVLLGCHAPPLVEDHLDEYCIGGPVDPEVAFDHRGKGSRQARAATVTPCFDHLFRASSQGAADQVSMAPEGGPRIWTPSCGRAEGM
jgi:GNAT superfamily N-acetyltransferase